MLARLSEIIDRARPAIPEALWATDEAERMKRLLARFPPAARDATIGTVRFGVLCLEFRLAEGSTQVDYSTPILKEDRDAILRLAATDDGAWLHRDRWWSRVLRLCERWADASSLLARHVFLVWLELDVLEADEERSALPAPGIFVGFQGPTTATTDASARRELLDVVCRDLADEPADPAVAERLEACLEALPDGSFLQYFGFMLSRGAGVLRFVFARWTVEQIGPFLRAIGWPGDVATVEGTLEALLEGHEADEEIDIASLQIDVTARGILPRLGLELPFDRETQSREGRVVEIGFLDRLTEHGLCTRSKRDALLELPGRDLEPWDERYRIGYARQIHHAKLVFDGGDGVEAKVYYGRFLALRGDPDAPPPDESALADALDRLPIG